MADLSVQNDLWSAATIGGLMFTALKIAKSYGMPITDDVMGAVPMISAWVANYVHNVIASRQPKPPAA